MSLRSLDWAGGCDCDGPGRQQEISKKKQIELRTQNAGEKALAIQARRGARLLRSLIVETW
jgi:hypothetical protein